MVFVLSFIAAALIGSPQSDSKTTVWSGVYSAAQAGRGQKLYEEHCKGCHQTNVDMVNPESRLKGNDFMERWREDHLDAFFNLVKATMPRREPGSLPDKTYVDIIAYLLGENGFPPGANELQVAHLTSVWVENKEGPQPLPNGSLVQVVGCLSNANQNWVLRAAGEPVRARLPGASSPAELEAAQVRPLGSNTFRLQNVDFIVSFKKVDLEGHLGHKMNLKGYLIRQPDRQRIDVTSIDMVESRCTP